MDRWIAEFGDARPRCIYVGDGEGARARHAVRWPHRADLCERPRNPLGAAHLCGRRLLPFPAARLHGRALCEAATARRAAQEDCQSARRSHEGASRSRGPALPCRRRPHELLACLIHACLLAAR